MRSLTLAALPRARGSKAVATITSTIQSLATRRTFSSLPSLRPTILAPSSTSSTVFRAANLPTCSFAPAPSSGAALDLVPKTSVTSHPSLAGCAAQVRFGPRPGTMARTSRLKRKRKFGFLARQRTRNGRKVLQRRRSKGRTMLSN
ncbi:hypothetical protein F4781DRAFT_416835 [Annulohypoxylon bovei var. microspora]|nr:hypothetical protein F4781DRAFT_416835 [Annulohypoxylon bovei var. microspora]